MAVIRINQFGGEMPSASSRALPAGAARRAFNLLARVNEFRPMGKDVVKTTKVIEDAKPATVFAEDGEFCYRFTLDENGNPYANDTLGWKTNPDPLNYVKGQIDDSQTERIYISSIDGTIAPRVVDATGVNKPLGVPAPAAAPSVTHNVVNEYSVDEDTAARASVPLALQASLKAAMSNVAIGSATFSAPSSIAAGWLAHGTSVTSGTLPTSALGDWALCVPMTGSVLTLPDYNYLMDTEFTHTTIVYGGVTYWAVPLTAQGIGYSINTTTLSSGIKAILNPDPGSRTASPATGYTYAGQLVPDANAATFATNMAAAFAVTEAPQKASIAALETAQVAFVRSMQDYSNQTLLAATVTAFYSGSVVAAEITAAIANFAKDIIAAEAGIVAAPVFMTSMDSFSTPAWTTPALTSSSTIISEVGTCLSFASDGIKVLDVETLRAWLRTTIEYVIGTISPAPVANEIVSMKDKITSAVDPVLARLADTISWAHWVDYPDWPLGSGYSKTEINANRTTAVVTAANKLKAAANRVTADYDAVLAKTLDAVKNVFDAEIAPYLPTPVTRLIDTRFYVTTLVTSWGEESSPSPVSDLLNVDQNDTVTVSRPSELSVSGTVSSHLLTGWRIYRSNVGNAGTAFQLVQDLPLATTTFTDDLKAQELQEVLPTTTWLVPPVNILPASSSMTVEYSVNGSTSWHSTYASTDLYRRQRIGSGSWSGATLMAPYLRGLTGMANGIMAGFYDNTVCFCEPFVPYAWPVEYRLTTKHAIVGMGSFGNTLFVGTKGIPYLFTGTDSASMSPQEIGTQSCSSARSIAPFETGVLYSSPDGICQADYSGVKVVTLGLFTKDDWAAINPSSIIGAMHHGVYYFLYNNRTVTSSNVDGISWGASLVTPANFKLLYDGLKQMIWDGNEMQARAIYLDKQTTYGFTDAQFAPYTDFTAAQIGQWKVNTTVDPVTNAKGTWPSRVTEPNGCYALDFATGKLTELDIQGTAFFLDEQTDTLYILDGTDIKALFADATERRTGEYWTGVIKMAKPEALAWLQVDSVFSQPVTIHWYGDGSLLHSTTVADNKPVRLPPGRYTEHQVMIESVDRITMVTLAGSTAELQAV